MSIAQKEVPNRNDWSYEPETFSEIKLPTLAHIPGVEPGKYSRYTTIVFKVEVRRRKYALQKPRKLFVPNRVIAVQGVTHLGRGRVFLG